MSDGNIFVSVSNGILYALDSTTGEEMWNYDPNSTTNVYSPTADPVVDNGVVYFMTSDINLTGVLHAVDLSSHQARWQFETPAENFSAPSISDGILADEASVPLPADAPQSTFNKHSPQPEQSQAASNRTNHKEAE